MRREQRLISTRPDVQALEDLTHRPGNNDTALGPNLSSSSVPRGDSSINIADRIQDQLREDGNLVWGFAVYRCTYSDDTAWETFLARLNASIRDFMLIYNGLDLLEEDCFKLTLFNDASKFDCVGAPVVRQHFKEWRKHAAREEQGTQEEIEMRRKRPELPHHPYGSAGIKEDSLLRAAEEAQEVNVFPAKEALPEMRRAGSGHGYGRIQVATRYKLCVQVDEAALQSIVSTEGEMYGGEAWLNLIEVDWELETAAAQRKQEKLEYLEMDLDPELFEEELEVFPEIDGCTEENVSWMKVHYQSLISELYAAMMDHNGFEERYTRPPGICMM